MNDGHLPGLEPRVGGLDPATARFLGICASCRAPVLWATNVTSGRRNPIDPRPTEGGNVKLTVGPAALVYEVPPAGERHKLAGTLHISHFVTCPNATSHRKKR
jgi:hypothetical protein